MTAALVLRDVHKTLRAGTPTCFARLRVLRGVSLRVAEGEFVSIIGPPASGKTALLLCASGLLRPDSGTIQWYGREGGARAGVCRYLSAREFGRGTVHLSSLDAVRLVLIDDADAIAPEALRPFLRSARRPGLTVVLGSQFPVPRSLNLAGRYELKDGTISNRAMVLGKVAEGVDPHARAT